MKTIEIEARLRMMKGIASLIATNLNLDFEDARAGAEAIWELLRQIEEDPIWEILRQLEAKGKTTIARFRNPLPICPACSSPGRS